MIDPRIVVNDDHASRYALRTAQAATGVPVRVASPVALVLLKLEAGGPLDTHDIVALVQVSACSTARRGWPTSSRRLLG